MLGSDILECFSTAFADFLQTGSILTMLLKLRSVTTTFSLEMEMYLSPAISDRIYAT